MVGLNCHLCRIEAELASTSTTSKAGPQPLSRPAEESGPSSVYRPQAEPTAWACTDISPPLLRWTASWPSETAGFSGRFPYDNSQFPCPILWGFRKCYLASKYFLLWSWCCRVIFRANYDSIVFLIAIWGFHNERHAEVFYLRQAHVFLDSHDVHDMRRLQGAA